MNQDQSTSSSSPATDIVSRRAYELWEKEGRPEGCDLRHWLQAEQECHSAQANGQSDNGIRNGSDATPAPTTASPGSDMRPLQGTRAGAAATREPKRATNSPFPGQKNSSPPAAAGVQSSGKRKTAGTPAL
jgi:hypothetical protein